MLNPKTLFRRKTPLFLSVDPFILMYITRVTLNETRCSDHKGFLFQGD